jgi:hypothetical protein
MGLIRKPNSRFWWINIKVGTKRIFESTKTENKKKAQEIYSIRHSQLLNEQTNPTEKQEVKKFKKIKYYSFDEFADQYLDWVNGRQKSYSRKKSIIKKLNPTSPLPSLKSLKIPLN